MAPGEKVIERVDLVEDSKGNSGDQGTMFMSNLRVVWYSINTPKLNICMLFLFKFIIYIYMSVCRLILIIYSISETQFIPKQSDTIRSPRFRAK